MAIIRYTKTYFKEPPPISEQDYINIKRQLEYNPHLDLDSKTETFSEHFKDTFSIIKYSIAIAIIAGILVGITGVAFFGVVAGISGGVALFSGFVYLMLEGPSYATYLKKKQEYFSRLKYMIQSTSSYQEFIRIYYRR